MSRDLIHRLQDRVRSHPTVDMAVCPPIRPRPPVSIEVLAAAEARLGFSLPPLVRALYTEVADGGYGPGYGLIQLDGHDYTVVGTWLWMNEFPGPAMWKWPERLIQLVNWGCHYFSGIDSADPSCPIFFYNNDRAIEYAALADCLLPEAGSLEEWLSAWLDGVPLWERGRQLGLHE